MRTTSFRAVRPSLAVATIALLAGAACTQTPPSTPPDLVVVNGAVYPGGGAPMAQAVAVSGTTVLRVGTTEEIRAMAGPQTTVVDAKGGSVVPGFNAQCIAS